MSLILYDDPIRGNRLEVPLPLEFNADVEALSEQLGLPAYLDLSNFQIRKAVVTLWAASHAEEFEVTRTRRTSGPQAIPIALFGGMAFRFQCPSANDPGGPFFRPLNDLDLITTQRHGSRLVNILAELSDRFGTGYGYWITRPDKTYNGFRGGRRYRLTTINDLDHHGHPEPGKLDILTESIGFCHDVDIRQDLELAHDHHFTLRLDALILLKCQFVRLGPKSDVPENDFRLLDSFDDNQVVLGMEPKDARDVCATLHDYAEMELPYDALRRALSRDWGLHRTVRLNLVNLDRKLEDLLGPGGASTTQISRVRTHLRRLLGLVENLSPRKPLFQLSRQWWRTVED